ncbi:uncharacterized protein LOC122570823 [Bombus pyrosoma]|uniref:uncharacterized protein LOC122570823 n=1 Tax=Bombus pyrosoma TaxID=396416 RepID=UPI001CB898F3|nr:uncharacterized protein LOC122570823 [Bombus pyrosoma]
MDILLQFFGRSEILSNARKIKEKMLQSEKFQSKGASNQRSIFRQFYPNLSIYFAMLTNPHSITEGKICMKQRAQESSAEENCSMSVKLQTTDLTNDTSTKHQTYKKPTQKETAKNETTPRKKLACIIMPLLFLSSRQRESTRKGTEILHANFSVDLPTAQARRYFPSRQPHEKCEHNAAEGLKRASRICYSAW